MVNLSQDISRYKAVILPTVFVLTREQREKLKQYVKQGGTLLATFLTGVKNEDNVGYTDTLPAGMTDVFGVSVEEVEPVFDANRTNLQMKIDGEQTGCQDSIWSELLVKTEGAEKAELIGQYVEDYKEGSAVISRNLYGNGWAYYMGTDLEEEVLIQLLDKIVKETGIHKNPVNSHFKDNVETVTRILDGMRYTFLFNFAGKPVEISLPEGGKRKDFLTGEGQKQIVFIEKNGFKVLEEVLV